MNYSIIDLVSSSLVIITIITVVITSISIYTLRLNCQTAPVLPPASSPTACTRATSKNSCRKPPDPHLKPTNIHLLPASCLPPSLRKTALAGPPSLRKTALALLPVRAPTDTPTASHQLSLHSNPLRPIKKTAMDLLWLLLWPPIVAPLLLPQLLRVHRHPLLLPINNNTYPSPCVFLRLIFLLNKLLPLFLFMLLPLPLLLPLILLLHFLLLLPLPLLLPQLLLLPLLLHMCSLALSRRQKPAP